MREISSLIFRRPSCRKSLEFTLAMIHRRISYDLHIFMTIFFCVVSHAISFIDHKYSMTVVIQDLSMCLCTFPCLSIWVRISVVKWCSVTFWTAGEEKHTTLNGPCRREDWRIENCCLSKILREASFRTK